MLFFSPDADKKLVTDNDRGGLMKFADTVASPMYCTQLYVRLQHTKTIIFQGEKLHNFGTLPCWKTGNRWLQAKLGYPFYQSFIPDFWRDEVVF